MSFMTKWSVSQEHPVTPGDLGTDGRVTDDAVERWVARARSAYLAQCAVLETTRAGGGLDLRHRLGPHPGTTLEPTPTVVITASATEVLPSSFVISFRLRPLGGAGDDPLNVSCEVWLTDPRTGAAHEIDHGIRDELIALEHAARYYN